MRTLLSRTTSSIILIKGFYKVGGEYLIFLKLSFQGHNSISFLSASLDLNKTTLATLYLEANQGKSWEATAVECLYDGDLVTELSL
jgi:hypothetical protein